MGLQLGAKRTTAGPWSPTVMTPALASSHQQQEAQKSQRTAIPRRRAIPLLRIKGDAARFRHFNIICRTLLRQAKELSITADAEILMLMRPKGGGGRVHSFCSRADVEGVFEELCKKQDPQQFSDGAIEDLRDIRRAFAAMLCNQCKEVQEEEQQHHGEGGRLEERNSDIVRGLLLAIRDCDRQLAALPEDESVASNDDDNNDLERCKETVRLQ